MRRSVAGIEVWLRLELLFWPGVGPCATLPPAAIG